MPFVRAERPKSPTAAPRQPDLWTEGSRPATVFSTFVRSRVRDAWKQAHRIAVARMRAAERPADVATFAGLVAEVKGVSSARREGQPEDVRCALLAVACSAVLLAEQADRGPEPKRGAIRAVTARWEASEFHDGLEAAA